MLPSHLGVNCCCDREQAMTGSKKGGKPTISKSIKRGKPAPKFDTVTEQGIPVLIRKKRHMSGLMCPPMGVEPKVWKDAEKQK